MSHAGGGPIAAIAAAFLLLALGPAADAAPIFVVTGRGFGHGIGMSQYGAQGFALHGWSYGDILERYYADTELTPGFPNSAVEVLLADGVSSLVLASDARFSFGGESLGAGSYTLTPSRARCTSPAPGCRET
jgi:stage II sporulation protein D